MCECVYPTSSFLLSLSVTSLLRAFCGSQFHSDPNKVGAQISNTVSNTNPLPVKSLGTPPHLLKWENVSKLFTGTIVYTCSICTHTSTTKSHTNHCSTQTETTEREHCVSLSLPLCCKNISSPPLLNSVSLSQAVRGDGEFRKGRDWVTVT